MRNRNYLCVALFCCMAACAADDDGFVVTGTSESIESSELAQLAAAGGPAVFRNAKSNRCIGVDGASTANGARLKQFTCDGSTNQTWLGTISGTQNIATNAKSHRCMGVDGASTANGAIIAQFTCDGSTNQKWTLTAVGGDIVTIRNGKSGRCIGVDGASTANGAQLKQFDCDGSLNQRWHFILQ
jgi:hypothetical protein